MYVSYISIYIYAIHIYMQIDMCIWMSRVKSGDSNSQLKPRSFNRKVATRYWITVQLFAAPVGVNQLFEWIEVSDWLAPTVPETSCFRNRPRVQTTEALTCMKVRDNHHYYDTYTIYMQYTQRNIFLNLIK